MKHKINDEAATAAARIGWEARRALSLIGAVDADLLVSPGRALGHAADLEAVLADMLTAPDADADALAPIYADAAALRSALLHVEEERRIDAVAARLLDVLYVRIDAMAHAVLNVRPGRLIDAVRV